MRACVCVKIAMRWRTKEEVLAGKGQFSCANLSCGNRGSTLDEDPDDAGGGAAREEGLRGFELVFEYVERGEEKSALVKVRVCDECTTKLQHIQGSGRQKERRRKERDRDRDRSRHREGSQSREERKRRKDESRDRDRRKHRERRRSRSPKKGGGGHMSRHRSGSPKPGKDEEGSRTS